MKYISEISFTTIMQTRIFLGRRDKKVIIRILTSLIFAYLAGVNETLEMLRYKKSTAQTCGVPKSMSGLIVRGQNFSRGSFPWMVALLTTEKQPPAYFCSGSLISRTYVVSGMNITLTRITKYNLLYASAAHCIRQKYLNETKLPESVLALFGAHNLSIVHETGRYTLSPRRIIIHEEWNSLTSQYDNDIALLEFETKSIFFSSLIQPICLFDYEENDLPKEGLVTGWGKNEENEYGSIPKIINAVIQPNEKCLPGKPRLAEISSLTSFCAGLHNGSGVCHGDSGGGLSVIIDGIYYLKGIVSSSLLKDGGCDVLQNSVYTNVPEFFHWIETKTGGKDE